MARIVLAALAVFSVLVLLGSVAADAPSCTTVDGQLNPCSSYIEGAVTSPSTTCCSGYKAIIGGIKGRDDKVNVCNCVKGVVAKLTNVVPSHISDLPKACGFPTNLLPIHDKNFNCSMIA